MRRVVFIIAVFSLFILNFDVHKNTSLLSLIDCSCCVFAFEYIDGCEYLVLDDSDCDIVNLLDVVVLNRRIVGGNEIIEGYTQHLPKYVSSDGYKINIQISKNADNVIVGYPLIKKSF